MSLTIREEQFLAKIAGEDVTTPEPLTREERFLAKIAGEDVTTPEPLTKEEQLLDKIASSGGGGGGGGNQYLVQIGTTTPRMVYEAIQQGKSIAILSPTSYEVSDTFPPTSSDSWFFYNNISDVTPVTMVGRYDTDTEVAGTFYQLWTCNEVEVASSWGSDEPFEG